MKGNTQHIAPIESTEKPKVVPMFTPDELALIELFTEIGIDIIFNNEKSSRLHQNIKRGAEQL